MNHAPTILYQPATVKKSRHRGGPLRLPAELSILPSGQHTPASILQVMSLNKSVNLVYPSEQQSGLSLVVAFALALVGGWVAGQPARLRFWQQKSAFRLASILTFGFAVSGVVYCIIRSPPLLGSDPRGKPELFSSQGRDQTVAEGVWIGALTVSVALAIITLTAAAKAGRGDISNTLVGVLLVGIIGALLMRIFELYRFKTGWYDPLSSVPTEWHEALHQASAHLQAVHQKYFSWISDHISQFLPAGLPPLIPPALR